MAITHIGTNTQDSSGAQSLTFTIPAGATTDDVMIAFVKQSENTGQQTWDDDGGGGNGWTREVYNRTTGGRDMESAIYWKVHDGSESNPTFTWNVGGTNEPMSGSLEVYRGCDTTNPIQDINYANAQNDANPPNPSVNIDKSGSTIVVFHCASHDDISSPAAPTGYTMRGQVWAGTANDHRNIFVADLINLGSSGAYTPPDWQHSVLNTTPEYHTYTLVLREPILIQVDDFNTTEKFNWGDASLVATGFGFETVEGTGKAEFWSDTSGTIKSEATTVTWSSDTSITITPVQGSLSNNVIVYLVITNDSGDESAPFPVTVGLIPYTNIIDNLLSDHFWKLNNTYDDTGNTGPVRNMTSGVVGTQTFSTTTLTEDTTHSLVFNSVTGRREIADSPNMNVTISSQERTIMCWIRLGGIQKSLSSIWKEGGGVQNLAFLVGQGNVLMWQLADVASTRDNVQAYSDFRLVPGRTYCIVGRYSHLDNPSESRLYIDGVKQSVTDGNPMVIGIFDSHSGDVVWNDSDNNLEMGAVDIGFQGQEDILISHFVTWSDNSLNTNSGGLSDTEIFELFERGAKPSVIISSDTQVNMQSDLDTYSDTVRPDSPLAIRIEGPTGGGNLELIADNITFDPSVSLELQWYGSGVLTWVLENGSSVNNLKFSTPGGGTVNIEENVPVKITVKDIDDNSLVEGARVLLNADSGGDLSQGTNIISGLTNVSGEISTSLRYTSDQPVTGRSRRATLGTLYKTSPISSTITSSGMDITIFMIKDQ